MSERTTLVVPCFNEAQRLDPDAFGALLSDRVELVFVDDGSTDTTREILSKLARGNPDRVRVIGLPRNGGKAEAVRRGLLDAVDSQRSACVGYLDADLATSPAEMLRLIHVMDISDVDVLLGARVALLGREIERRSARHYLGRVFATLASLALRLPTYDTQCGAKLFRVSTSLVAALREPFLSRWAFDIELLGRLVIGSSDVPGIDPSRVWEEPLLAWRDVKGSKVHPRQMVTALLDLARIDRDLARRRRAAATRPRSDLASGPRSAASKSHG